MDEDTLPQQIKHSHSKKYLKEDQGGFSDAAGERDLLKLVETIFLTSPAGILLASGPERTIRMASPNCRGMLPHPEQEVIGRRVQDIWPPEEGYGEDDLIRRVQHNEPSVLFERFEHVYPDGRRHSFSLRLARVTFQQEAGVLFLIQDTTWEEQARRRVVEETVEASRKTKELEAIITAMAEAVVLFNTQGIAIRANPAALDLFGIEPVGMEGEELIELLTIRSPNGSPVTMEETPMIAALAGDTVAGQRLLLLDIQGQERVVHVSASPLYQETGISSVITVWHDVSERERLVEQLEIEQSRLQTIIENAPEAILVADEDGRLVMGNRAAERILGGRLPYGEDYAQHRQMNFCHPDGTAYDPRNLPLTCSALDGEWIFNLEMLIAPAGQEQRYILFHSAPIVDVKGNLNGAVGVLQDITEQKRAEAALREQARRSELLATLSRIFAEAGLNYRELLDTIVEQISLVFGDFCSLHLFDTDNGIYRTAALYLQNTPQLAGIEVAVRGLNIPAGSGTAWEELQQGRTVMFRDRPVMEILAAFAPGQTIPSTENLPDAVNEMAIPLRAYGRRIGILNLIRGGEGQHFTTEEQVFLQDLADRAALAIEDAHLYEQEAQRARYLQALSQETAYLLTTLDLDTMIGQIAEAGMRIIPSADSTVVFLTERGSGLLQARAAAGQPCPERIYDLLAEHIEDAIEQRLPQALDCVMRAEGEDETTSGAEEEYAALVAPMLAQKDIRGALVLVGKRPATFTKNEQRLLGSFSATAAVALQNAMLYAEVQRLATTDTLTGQYNRRKFFELGALEMHRFQRFHTPLSAIMFDLDNFKAINDAYGHGTGDAVLRCVAQRARMNTRVIDILGRYGGDEFSILLPNADIQEAEEIAGRIRAAIAAEAVVTPAGALQVSISVGVAQASQGTDSLSTLLGRADGALYQAKEKGRNRIERG